VGLGALGLGGRWLCGCVGVVVGVCGGGEGGVVGLPNSARFDKSKKCH